MTTRIAEALYLAQHQAELYGRSLAVFNPNGTDISKLPVIYGWSNGGSPGWHNAIAMAEDGNVLGQHSCSAEGYVPHDLGLLEGTRPDRHETYRAHYPNGYRMEFVSMAEVKAGHPGVLAAYEKNQALREQHETK